MSNFEQSLTEVLKEEGGYVNHPKDPGGATNMGVTQRVYDDYRKRRGLTARPVRQIDTAEVKAIYQASYWYLARCEELPPGIDHVVFDGAVNSGVKQSVKWLQRALGVRDDGIIGPTTINAALAADKVELVDAICDARLAFLKVLDTWPTFGRGWQRRVARVRSFGKALASNSPASVRVDEAVTEPTPKARLEDVKTAPPAAIGDAMTGAGAMGGVLTQTIEQLTPLAQVDFVAKVITVLTVASVVLALAGIAYGIYARHRKAQIADATQVGTP